MMPRSTQRPCLQGHAQPSRADGRVSASETTTVSNRTDLGTTPRHHSPRKRTQTEGGLLPKTRGTKTPDPSSRCSRECRTANIAPPMEAQSWAIIPKSKSPECTETFCRGKLPSAAQIICKSYYHRFYVGASRVEYAFRMVIYALRSQFVRRQLRFNWFLMSAFRLRTLALQK